jgi:hypothetical protein
MADEFADDVARSVAILTRFYGPDAGLRARELAMRMPHSAFAQAVRRCFDEEVVDGPRLAPKSELRSSRR